MSPRFATSILKVDRATDGGGSGEKTVQLSCRQLFSPASVRKTNRVKEVSFIQVISVDQKFHSIVQHRERVPAGTTRGEVMTSPPFGCTLPCRTAGLASSIGPVMRHSCACSAGTARIKIERQLARRVASMPIPPVIE